MQSRTITLNWPHIAYDVKAATWKEGNQQQREDGLHAERQMGDEGVDFDIAKRSGLEGMYLLVESVKNFLAPVGGSVTSDLPADFDGMTDDGEWTIALLVNNRCSAIDNQLSSIGHSFVVSYIMMDWYRVIDPAKEKEWSARMAAAETRLGAALYHKAAPVLTTT